LTGATGSLGSHIAAEFAKRGYSLWIVARPGKDRTARERVEQLFDWLGAGPWDPSKIRVLEGYLDQPDLGIDRTQYNEVLDHVDEIIHCASSTSFSERKREEVERANIRALQNVLDLAARSRSYYFHHVSTAFVAGRREGLCREELVETNQFTNVYEETKYRGERMVAGLCAQEGIRLNIYRPSIVYGNSKDGRSLNFRGLYYPVRTVFFFKNLYETDIKENGGKRAKEMGVRLEGNGFLRLPIRLEVNAVGGINLIPVDFFLQAFLAVMEESLEGGIFHIVNRRLKKIEELIDYTQRLFQISGIQAASSQDFAKVSRNALEILFDCYLEAYKPYICDSRIFESAKAESILQKRQIACPDLDFGIFSSCLRYAVASGWGAKLLKGDVIFL
jgi:nucleoside-diphosphate-sugar epimerase